jgi:hypothetical protein
MLKDARSKLRCSTKHRSIARSSEIKDERLLGSRRPALVFVWLLLVGAKAIAAPPTTTGPQIPVDPCAVKVIANVQIKCPAGQTWPADEKRKKLQSEHSISTHNSYRHIEANGIPNHCEYKAMRGDAAFLVRS